MTPLQTLLDTYRSSSMTEREKGTYFEKLIVTYLRHEATYADLYSDVWLYSDWAKEQGLDAKDTGIDLVAKTAGLLVLNIKLTLRPFLSRTSNRCPTGKSAINDVLFALQSACRGKLITTGMNGNTVTSPRIV